MDDCFTAGWSGEQGELDLGLQDVSEVALFSGGLDSTSYAAAATHRQQRLLLVSYAHNERAIQNRVFHGLWRIDPDRRLARMVQFRQLPRIPEDVRARNGLGNEYTSRSRGLLFIAAAVYAAAAYGVTRVAVPENGQLAINPPLAPDRIGACCTRTAHPLSLHLINRIIAEVSDGDAVVVHNPLRDLTKAEVCVRARDAGLSDDILSKTVSCSKVTGSQRRQQHCGHCWACLVRRAALLHADPTTYEIKPWRETSPAITGDLDALRFWLAQPFGVPELAADIPIPDSVSLRHLVSVIEHGRHDLRRMDDWETEAASQ